MEDKSMKINDLFKDADGFEKAFDKLVEGVVGDLPFGSSKLVFTLMTPEERTETLQRHYSELVRKLHEKTTEPLKKISLHLEMSRKKTQWEDLETYIKKLEKVKQSTMDFAFRRLEHEVIDASRTAQGMAELMHRRKVTDDEFHRIVSGLARWHVLDDLQKQLQPTDFSACFAGFGSRAHPGGRPVEDLYDGVDKVRLRKTLEALYRKRYGMEVAEGWKVVHAHTRQFLLAFMLSLFHRPLAVLYGKMSAFFRFFTEECKFGFLKTARTLQNWLKAYQDFVNERERRADGKPQAEPQHKRDAWLRKVRRYRPLEELVQWIQPQLPKYDVALA